MEKWEEAYRRGGRGEGSCPVEMFEQPGGVRASFRRPGQGPAELHGKPSGPRLRKIPLPDV